MKRVLVLGGYGGFGARLSCRLANDGWQVLVAGRNLAAAKTLASELPDAEPVLADRNGDIAALLVRYRPDVLVDAAGPFQGSDYHVPRACIAFGIPYIDLADARDFVGQISQLDTEARAAGVAIISGASSVPALSGAVVAELSHDMDTVAAIDISISASAKTTAGGSVAAAVLSYVGKPVRLWRGRRYTNRTGWHLLRREQYTVPGRKPLNRLVSLADVPDHDLLPEMTPGRPATTFRAGSDISLQMIALWLLAWPVRWGVIGSLSAWSWLILPLQRAMAKLGGDSSAMAVVVKGSDSAGHLSRRWNLIAEQGEGAEIPTLAAQLLMRKLADGTLAAGACNASGLLTLDGFRSCFADMPFFENRVSVRPMSVYRRALGSKWAVLPESVRNLHDFIGDGGYAGTATVQRGAFPLARLLGGIMRFPPSGEYPVHVEFEDHGGKEIWIRDFGGHCFSSELGQWGAADGGGVIERFGPMRFCFDLSVDATGLRMVLRRWSILGIPMPLWLGPRISASETAEGEDFIFDVDVAMPLVGRVVHYRGRLKPLD